MKTNTIAGWVAGLLLTGGSAMAGYVWVDDDAAMVDEAPPITKVEDFREPLAEHGTWMEVESYGRVWQPTVVRMESGWKPYCHGGRWVWSDRGWYWSSTYKWGWAPFHYGRWAVVPRIGWVWVPDVTWGPSWVEWRSSDSYVGWTPARPAVVSRSTTIGFSAGGLSVSYTVTDEDYSYVPVSRFTEVEIVPYMVPHCRDEHYRREAPRYDHHGRYGDGDHRGDAPAPRPAPPTEPPRYVNGDSGRRTDRLQQLYTQAVQAPPRPAPATVRSVPSTRPQGSVSRSDALLSQVNRSVPVRTQAPAASAVVRKPITEILTRRNISPEQLKTALTKAEQSPRYSKLAKEVKDRWAKEH